MQYLDKAQKHYTLFVLTFRLQISLNFKICILLYKLSGYEQKKANLCRKYLGNIYTKYTNTAHFYIDFL